jgi:uncharacterized protein YjbI with pentapeptide repeats
LESCAAELRNADLSDTDLSDSRISRADIRNVDFGSTDLRDAVGVPDRASSARYSDTVCPDGNVQSSNCWP